MVQLEKRKIGDSSLEIGALGLGCAPLGGNFVDLDYAQGAESFQQRMKRVSGFLIQLPGMGLDVQNGLSVTF